MKREIFSELAWAVTGLCWVVDAFWGVGETDWQQVTAGVVCFVAAELMAIRMKISPL